MKGFASGVGGVCVCMLAIMGTVLCGFALGPEERQDTTTEYTYTADTTGLFDVSQTKKFTDYNPAANWTGYRSNEGDTALGGVTYTASAKINGYPVPQGMQYLTSKTFNTRTTELPQANPPGGEGLGGLSGLVIHKSQRFDTITYMTDYIKNPRVTTVAEFLEVFQPTLSGVYAEWEEMVIQFQTANSSTINGTCAQIGDWYYNWIAWSEGKNRQKAGFISYDTLLQCYYIKITKITQTVTAYGADGTQIWQCPTTAAGLVYMQIDAGDYPVTTNVGDVKNIGSAFQIGLYNTAPTEYMDVSKGVVPSTAGYGTYWSNGYTNGRIDMLIRWNPSADSTKTTFWARLPVTVSGSDGTTKELNYYVGIYYTPKAGNTSSLEVLATNFSGMYEREYAGNFSQGALLSLDMIDDKIDIFAVDTFQSFQDYTLLADPIATISSAFSSMAKLNPGQIEPGGISAASMTVGSENTAADPSKVVPTIGVVGTSVYMGDSTIVMADPSIQPVNLWTGYDPWELRLYSFAIVGDSVALADSSGTLASWTVTDGEITVDGKAHALNNLWIRAHWTGSQWDLSLVFGDETPRKAIPVASTTDTAGPTITLGGYWYFSSAYYSGQEKTTYTYDFDFQHFIFNSNAAILCYMGILIAGAIVAKRLGGLGIYDMIVLVFAGVCGFVLMA